MVDETTNKHSLLKVVTVGTLVAALLLCCGVGAVLLSTAIERAEDARKRQQVEKNFEQIGVALEQYQQTHPPTDNDEPNAAK